MKVAVLCCIIRFHYYEMELYLGESGKSVC